MRRSIVLGALLALGMVGAAYPAHAADIRVPNSPDFRELANGGTVTIQVLRIPTTGGVIGTGTGGTIVFEPLVPCGDC